MGVTGDWRTKISKRQIHNLNNVNSYKLLLLAIKGVNGKVRNDKYCNSSLGLLQAQVNMTE